MFVLKAITISYQAVTSKSNQSFKQIASDSWIRYGVLYHTTQHKMHAWWHVNINATKANTNTKSTIKINNQQWRKNWSYPCNHCADI